MPRRRPGRPYKPNTLRKWREVRDIVNRLRKKYRADVVYEFIKKNYFIDPSGVNQVLAEVDNEKVTDASMIHQAAMRDDFNL